MKCKNCGVKITRFTIGRLMEEIARRNDDYLILENAEVYELDKLNLDLTALCHGYCSEECEN